MSVSQRDAADQLMAIFNYVHEQPQDEDDDAFAVRYLDEVFDVDAEDEETDLDFMWGEVVDQFPQHTIDTTMDRYNLEPWHFGLD